MNIYATEHFTQETFIENVFIKTCSPRKKIKTTDLSVDNSGKSEQKVKNTLRPIVADLVKVKNNIYFYLYVPFIKIDSHLFLLTFKMLPSKGLVFLPL